MNKELKKVSKTLLCAVCKSADKSVFIKITNCILCKKCQNELSKSFEKMLKNREDDDYPEL